MSSNPYQAPTAALRETTPTLDPAPPHAVSVALQGVVAAAGAAPLSAFALLALDDVWSGLLRDDVLAGAIGLVVWGASTTLATAGAHIGLRSAETRASRTVHAGVSMGAAVACVSALVVLLVMLAPHSRLPVLGITIGSMATVTLAALSALVQLLVELGTQVWRRRRASVA